MSRIGRQPIAVPAGVNVTIAEGNVVTVKGPLGELTRTFNTNITIAQEGAQLIVTRPNDEKQNRALHGLTRTLLNNMVVGVKDGFEKKLDGVKDGFEKKLEIVGVGYRVEKQSGKIVLGLGYSHPVIFEEKDGVKFECPDANTILVKGIDKQAVGQVAAVIRSKRPPEPYLGKGVKYSGERIRRKAGKTGK